MSEATYFVLDIDDERASAMRSFGPAGGLGTRSLTGSGGTRRAVATPLKVSAEKMTPKQVADARRGDPRRMIERAFPLRLLKPMGTPVAAAAGSSAWGLAATMADGSALDGSGVTVAVLDTGIDRTHPAFAAMGGRLVTRDFTDDAGTAIDTQGHGSHCAGTIFGGDVGGTRIGIARNVSRALVGKVLPDDRPGDSAMLFKAMQWAAGENANIVSMSLGFDFPGMVAQLVDEGTPPAVATSNALVLFSRNLRGFDRLMSFFRASADMLVVAAAGNESDRPANVRISASLPAAAEQILVVGAYGRKGKAYEIASFSNVDVTISAPGVGILSAGLGGGLVTMSGTSQACPHIAGLAALWWQKIADSGETPTAEKVREKLFGAVTLAKLPTDADESERGRGRALAPKT